MPTINLPSIVDDPKLEDVIDAFERLRKELTWLLESNLDTKNAREFAGWRIRPDKMVSADGDVGMSTEDTGVDDVRFFAGPNGDVWFYYVTKSGKLYATDAFITGTVTGSTVIGSEVMTKAKGVYPRAEMSSTNNLFKAEGSATKNITIEAGAGGTPTIFFTDSLTGDGTIANYDTDFLISTVGGKRLKVSSSGDLPMVATGVMDLQPTGSLKINGTTGYTGTFAAGTSGNLTVTVKKGIITDVS